SLCPHTPHHTKSQHNLWGPTKLEPSIPLILVGPTHTTHKNCPQAKQAMTSTSSSSSFLCYRLRSTFFLCLASCAFNSTKKIPHQIGRLPTTYNSLVAEIVMRSILTGPPSSTLSQLVRNEK